MVEAGKPYVLVGSVRDLDPAICVDINPVTVTKLADRGSAQAMAIVTDIGLFLEAAGPRAVLIVGLRPTPRPGAVPTTVEPVAACLGGPLRGPLGATSGVAFGDGLPHQVGSTDDPGLRAEGGSHDARSGPEAAAGQRPLQPLASRP